MEARSRTGDVVEGVERGRGEERGGYEDIIDHSGRRITRGGCMCKVMTNCGVDG